MELPGPVRDALAPVQLTLRGAGFLTAAILGVIIAYVSGWPALLAVALFLLGAVVAALAAVVLAPPTVTIDRRLDPVVVEQREPVRVRVSVRGRAPGAVDFADTVPKELIVVGRTEGRLSGVVAERAAVLIEYTVAARHRGPMRVGPLRLARTDALGLAVTRRSVGDAAKFIVLPRTHPITLPAAVTRADPDPAASTEFGPAGDQRDIVARVYRAGDPLRSVDWRATAHRGELMVRTEAAATVFATGLALECRSGAWAAAEDFEWAVEYTASLAAALGARRAGVRLAVDAKGPVSAAAEEALIALALVTRTTGAPRVTELVNRAVSGDVQLVHVVTGPGSAGDLHGLPALPHGATGLVSVVGRGIVVPEVPRGWRATALDPRSRVGEVRIGA